LTAISRSNTSSSESAIAPHDLGAVRGARLCSASIDRMWPTAAPSMKIENTTMVASQNYRPKLDAITPATPYPTFARPTSHWNRLVGQSIDSHCP
jgi:hypothetical protein